MDLFHIVLMDRRLAAPGPAVEEVVEVAAAAVVVVEWWFYRALGLHRSLGRSYLFHPP
jgi:hypothetical protein